MRQVTAKEIMSKGVLFANYTDKIYDVADIMYNKGIGSVIIKVEGIAEGIMTERDIVHNCFMGKNNIYNTTVGDIMSKPIAVVNENTSVFLICSLMKEKNIKKMAIIDDTDEVVGIVTMTDIVNNLKRIIEEASS